MTLENAALYIQTKLLEKGFIIHRYNAYSTNSIYLKLDYGAMNSIRISDHKGYDHLSYKYNIDINYKGNGSWKKDTKGLWKFFTSTHKKSLDALIDIILADKLLKKTKYNYEQLVIKFKGDISNQKGFWEQAYEVKLEV